jgi:hypothetical protein
MTFNIGRRIQQLKIQNSLYLITHELKKTYRNNIQNIRNNNNNSNKNHDNDKHNNSDIKDINKARVVSTYVFFPCEISLSTATGAGDMYTQVSKIHLKLPSFMNHNDHRDNNSSSDNNNDNNDNNNNNDDNDNNNENNNNFDSINDDNNGDENYNNNDDKFDDKVNNSNSFIINNDTKLSSEFTQDLATSLRSRSWRLDVRTLHGICLEISCTNKNDYYSNDTSMEMEIQNGDFKRKTEFHDFNSNTDDSDTGDFILSGRWVHTKDIISKKPEKSEESEESKRSNIFNTCLNIELFEASFDVDLFQVRFSCLLHTYTYTLIYKHICLYIYTYYCMHTCLNMKLCFFYLLYTLRIPCSTNILLV